MTEPKILILDIETKPAIAYVWRLFDENVSIEQLIAAGGMICVGATWLGSKTVEFFSEWEHGHKAMLKGIRAMLEEADAVVTYNGDKFDLPKLRGEFATAGMTLPPPTTSIDMYKVVKRFSLTSHKLAFVGPYFKIGTKIKNEGFSLWRGVMEGDPKCQRKMKAYCIQDVKLLALVYSRLLPYIENHPKIRETPNSCPNCGGTDVVCRGHRYTRTMKIQRVKCKSCGSWHTGKRQKIT